MKINSIQFNIKYPAFTSSGLPAVKKSFFAIFKKGSINVKNPYTRDSDVFISQKKSTNEVEQEKPDYSNIEAFSKHLEEKFKLMHLDYTESDITNIVSDISDKTGASKKTVAKVISRLTQFSSYSQLSMFEKDLNTNKITSLARIDAEHVSLNDVMSYLMDKKAQIHLDSNEGKDCIFIDDVMLDYFEKLKNTYGNYGQAPLLFNKIQNGQKKLVLIDGFNAKVDGEDISHTLFGSRLSLEKSAEKIVREMQKGTSLDEIMNGDTIKRTKEIFGDNVDIALIKNRTTKPTPKNIAETMESLHPNKKDIEKSLYVIPRLAPKARLTREGEDKTREFLSKYYDYMLCSFSQESLTKELKEKYKAIENKVQELGKTMDDVVYIIPETGKSYDLITYQYAKTNDIPHGQIKRFDGYNIDKNEAKDKVFVVLDDVVGSGMSITLSSFDYGHFCDHILNNTENSNFIFSPVCVNVDGKKKIEEKIAINKRDGKDFLISNEAPNYYEFKKTLPYEDKHIHAIEENVLGKCGFGRNRACISFPYMIPDNNSSASGFLLQHTLKNNRANKSDHWCNWINNRIENEYKKIKQEYEA